MQRFNWTGPHLHRHVVAQPLPPPPSGALRVVTYNIHSCIGRDNKASPERIARVIELLGADVVALQEVEVGRRRTGSHNQAGIIAKKLGMHEVFHPAMLHPDGKYGLAIVSRFPLQLLQARTLPRPNLPFVQPRVAMLVSFAWGGYDVRLLNTHLGLLGPERHRQVDALIGTEWLAPHAEAPLLMCGDLNATPTSRVCRKLRRLQLQDALAGNDDDKTFPSNLPFIRLDHVLLSPLWRVLQATVPRHELTWLASDHLPIVADITLDG